MHKDGNKINNVVKEYQIVYIGFIIKDACLRNRWKSHTGVSEHSVNTTYLLTYLLT